MSTAGEADILITNKNMILTKLSRCILPNPSMTNKIDTVQTYGHIPSLPRHLISQMEMVYIQSIISPCLSIADNQVSKLFTWKQLTWACLSVCDRYIYALRAVHIDIYNQNFRPFKFKTSSHIPMSIYVNTDRYILTEEGVLFYSH